MVTADDLGGLRKLAGIANGIAADEGLASLDWNWCGGRLMEPGTGILLLPIRGIRDCVGSFDIFSSKLDPIRVPISLSNSAQQQHSIGVCAHACTHKTCTGFTENSHQNLHTLKR